MAIDVCSEISSPGISPRISFSYDLNQSSDVVVQRDQDHTHQRLDSSLLDFDFHFPFHNSKSIQEVSSADELFSNGKILPIHAKKPSQCARPPYPEVRESSYVRSLTPPFLGEAFVTCKKPSILGENNHHQINPTPSRIPRTKRTTDQAKKPEKKLLKEFLSMSLEEETEEKPNKSFWQFKRSVSLNCDSTTKNKGLIRSLHFLSRSNSTGSAPNPQKQSALPISTKEAHNNKPPHLQKHPSVTSRRRPSVSGLAPFYPYNNNNNIASQKPPPPPPSSGLRKCKSYGNGVSPILNIPPACISRGPVGLFGLGSLFCSNKVKKKSR